MLGGAYEKYMGGYVHPILEGHKKEIRGTEQRIHVFFLVKGVSSTSGEPIVRFHGLVASDGLGLTGCLAGMLKASFGLRGL